MTRAKNGQAFFDFLHSNFYFSTYLFRNQFLRKVYIINVMRCETLHSNIDYHQKLNITKGKAMLSKLFPESNKVV